MSELAATLRADRHDRVVQLKGKEIEERLEKMGHEVEAQEAKQEKEAKLEERMGPAPKTGKKPAKSSQFSNVPAKVEKSTDQPWRKNQDDWAKLQPERRAAVLQTWSEEFSPIWRKRLIAYFSSVNDDEVERSWAWEKVVKAANEAEERRQVEEYEKGHEETK